MNAEIPRDADGVDDEAMGRTIRERVANERKERDFASSPQYRDLLINLRTSLLASTRFEPGQIVKWKSGLQNKSFPFTDSVGIVIEHLSEPFILSDRDSGSQYFREPLDLAVAALVGDERQFAVYWFDSRRFELVDGV